MYNFDYVDEPMLNCTKYAASINCNDDKKLKIDIIEKAVIIPNCYSSSAIVLESEYANNNLFVDELLECESEPVIYLGSWYNVWGHLLTDSLSKFWIMFSEFYNQMSLSKYDLVYCIDSIPFPKQFEDLIDLMGIDKSKLRRIDKPTLFKKIYVPDDSIYVKNDVVINEKDADRKGGLYFYCDEYKKTIDKIKNSVKKVSKCEKIYFSVGNTSKFFGGVIIEKTLKEMGFRVINPYDLPFKDQLSILLGCKVFCTIEGSISFNALFLTEGTEIVLIRKLPYIDPYQFMINQISNLKVTYIDSHLSVFCDRNYPYLGPFYLYPNENFANFVNSFGYDCKVDFSFSRYLNYVISAFKSQFERKQFLKQVCWETDMYYFELLEKYFKKDIFMRKIVKLLPK